MTTTIDKRFFAFGCSFTRYSYPTWADIIGYNFKEYYNFGHPGCGNYYIFNSIIEAHNIFNFSNNDVIIVEWSDEIRHDAFINDRWYRGFHNVVDYHQFHDWAAGSTMKTLSFMNAIEHLFNLKGLEYHYITMLPLQDPKKISKNYITKKYHKNCLVNENVFGNADFLKFYEKTVSKIKTSIKEFLNIDVAASHRSVNGVIFPDGHPLPWEYYDYVKHVFPQYLPDNSVLRDQLIEVFNETVITDSFIKDRWSALQKTKWPIDIGTVGDEQIAFTTTYVAFNKYFL